MWYKKLDKNEFLKNIVIWYYSFDWCKTDNLWSIKSVSKIYNTSKYQARKVLRSLRDEGYIKYISVVYWCDCWEFHECDPSEFVPYNWNIPTEKARDRFKIELEKHKNRFKVQMRIWEISFDIIEKIDDIINK